MKKYRRRSINVSYNLLKLKPIGYQSVLHDSLNQLSTYIHRKVEKISFETAKKEWDIKGLFINEEAIAQSCRPYITFTYEFTQCNTIMAIIIPKLTRNKYPSHINILHRGKFADEFGIWIDFKNWIKITDLIIK